MRTAYDFAASNFRKMFVLAAFFILLSLVISWGIGYGIGLAHAASSSENNFWGRLSKTIVSNMLNSMVPPSKAVVVEEPLFITDYMKTEAVGFAWRTVAICFFGLIFWVLWGYKYGESMTLSAAHAVRLQEKDHRELYRRATTICKMAGIAPPKLYVILDDSLNAMTTGVNKNNVSIAITSGLMEKLSGAELEVVLAQQVAHIQLGNTKLWLGGLTTVLLFNFLSETFFAWALVPKRGVMSSFLFTFVGAACWLVAVIFAPLMNLVISRQSAYYADAQAVLLCRNAQALITALKKIEKDYRVELLDLHPSLAGLCIVNPRKKGNLLMQLSGLDETHPSIASRLEALQEMDGR